ncbi:MAG: hypothetical protein KH353_11465 [Clostridium sp.]|nr:hypothetical protein [Clostridium sp.]
MLRTKYTVTNKRPSYAFLMEMLWVCGFFAIAACIFVMAFAKADTMSRKAQDLNEAVMAAEQEMEQTFLSEREGIWSVCLDQSWKPVSKQPDNRLPGGDGPFPKDTYAVLHVTSQSDDGLLNVSIQVDTHISEPAQETIYTLEGSHMTDREEADSEGNSKNQQN